jgi:RNA polymerase primary sigma factor
MVKLTRKSVVMKIRKKPPQEEFVSQAVRTGGDGQDAQEIAFIDNALFHADHAEDELFGEGSERIEVADWHFISPSCLEADGPPIKTKVLTPKQEKLLFLRYNYARRRIRQAQIRGAIRGTFESLMIWRQRAQDARDALVNANMALVPAMLRRVNCPNVELEELISEGNVALLRCVDRFDVSRGFRFSTYACRAIIKAFHRLASRRATYQKHFPAQYDPQMEKCDLGDRIHRQRWQDSIEWVRDMLTDNQAKLTLVEQTVLLERFAMAREGKGMTFEQIGPIIGLSPERTRQILRTTLRKVREAFDKDTAGPVQLAGA